MITPSDSASDPAGYDAVTPAGPAHRPAPYDIQAPQGDLSGVFDAANAVAGSGVLYAQGPRQAAAEAFLDSPQGAGEFNVTAGYSGGGGEDWPGDVKPGG